eukprot:gene646-1248_t
MIHGKENQQYVMNKKQQPKRISTNPRQQKQKSSLPLSAIHGNTGNITTSNGLPILVCQKFQEPIWLGFGCVDLNSTIERKFQLSNPFDSKTLKVSIGNVPTLKGFNIYLGNSTDKESTISPLGSVIGTVSWQPTSNLSVRDEAILLVDDKVRLYLNLHGMSGIGEETSVSKENKPVMQEPDSDMDLSNSDNIQKAVINHMKKHIKKATSSTLVIPETKLIKKIDWAEKQEIGFSSWLNNIFQQGTHETTAVTAVTEESDMNVFTAGDGLLPSGLRSLIQERIHLQNRMKCQQLYNHPSFQSVIVSLETEVDRGRLAVRDDQDMHSNISLKDKFTQLLLQYELKWLRVAFEAIFQENYPSIISDIKLKQLIKICITDKILSDFTITEKYAKNGRHTASIRDTSMKSELRKHSLIKFLTVVLLLDRARVERILCRPSRLFCSQSTVKTSKEVIEILARDFLRGEGLVAKHLLQLGFKLNFEQKYTDEFEYRVTDLSVDLRDGVRLARLVELLTKTPELSSLLRVPAVSRLQKVYNVGLVLQKLSQIGVRTDIDPKNLADGKKDQILLLLWKIIFHFEIHRIIDCNAIRKEIDTIQKSQCWRRSVYTPHEAMDLAVKVPVKGVSGLVAYPESGDGEGNNVSAVDDDKAMEAREMDLASSLVDWCDVIGSQYGAPVENLTSSLSDGRVLCLIVHYYHPTILPTRIIRRTCSHIPVLDGASRSERHQALEGEHRNFALLRHACEDIGGIPITLPTCDSKTLPERRTMTLFLSFLFSRLVESSNEVRAAIRIQRKFRLILSKLIARRRPTHKKIVCPKDVTVTIFALDRPEVGSVTNFQEIPLEFEDIDEDEDLNSDDAEEDVSKNRLETVDNEAMKNVQTAKEVKDAEDARLTAEMETAAALQAETMARLTEAVERELSERLERERAIRVEAEESARLAREEAVSIALEVKLAAERDMLIKVEETRLAAEQEAMMRALEARIASEAAVLEERQARLAAEARLHALELETKAAEDARLTAEMETAAALQAETMARLAFQEQETARLEAEKLQMVALEEAEMKARAIAVKQAETEAVERELSERLERERAIRVEAEENLRLLLETKISEEREARLLVENRMQQELEIRAVMESRLKEFEAREAARLDEQGKKMEELQHASVLLIQKVWRGHTVRLSKSSVLKYVLIIQSTMRSYIARKTCHKKLKAIIVIQCSWRVYSASQMKSNLQRQREENAVARLVAEDIHRIAMVSKIQCFWRDARQRAIASHRTRAISIIQSLIRTFLHRCRLLRKLAAVRVVQHRWRVCITMKQSRCALTSLRQQMLLKIQAKNAIVTYWRRFVARSQQKSAALRLERWMIAYLPLLRARKLNRGFRRLQATFRANKIRISSPSRIVSIRKRLHKAWLKACADPSLRLGKRTVAALLILESGKMISHVIRACETLLLSTQYSTRCCKAFAETSASTVMFDSIRSCNRSTPHQELLRYCLAVLLNVARYPDLAPSVGKASHAADTLIDLMQMFRDKRSIFCQSAEVLCNLVSANENVRDQCNLPEFRKRIDGIFHIIERKHRLEVRVNTVNSKTGGKTPRVSPNRNSELQMRIAAKEIPPIDLMRNLMTMLG